MDAKLNEQRSLADRAKDEVFAWFGNPGAALRLRCDSLDLDTRIVDAVIKRLAAEGQTSAPGWL